MKGIFVNENEKAYAYEIVEEVKTVETRNKNMLSACVGERVAIISTKRGCKPSILGFVDVVAAHRKNWVWLDQNRDLTRIPKGSDFDTPIRWCYFLRNPEKLDEPILLPANAIRHGRSWCEF